MNDFYELESDFTVEELNQLANDVYSFASAKEFIRFVLERFCIQSW